MSPLLIATKRLLIRTPTVQRICWLSSGGGYSRMLDMGGTPGAHSTKSTPINTSKNNQLQVIAFDFDLLTRSSTAAAPSSSSTSPEAESTDKGKDMEEQTPDHNSIMPNVGMVQDIAKLLNVELGGDQRSKRTRNDDEMDDDLSLLTGESKEEPTRKAPKPAVEASSVPGVGSADIREKYAAKLRKKLDGGLSGIERAKASTSPTEGDADTHMAARKIAIEQGSASRQSKWMALTGTGTLLQYLSNRSMKICLLPHPDQYLDDEEEQCRMKDFQKQLPSVQVDLMARFEETSDHQPSTPKERMETLLKNVLDTLDVQDAKLSMIVSDRDDYLRQAKDLGMVVCRMRQSPKARRGNVSEHYLVESIPEIQEVIDEINGISFNALRQ